MQLGEFHLDKLPQAERMAIARHVRECPHCRTEIRQLESYLRELALAADAPAPLPPEPFRVLAARLLGGGRPAQAWAGVRGQESGARMYQADDVQVTIDVQEDPRDPARRVLLGLVIGMPLAGMEAHLYREDEHIRSVAVEEAGNFILPGVEPGRYGLSLRGTNMRIEIQDLDVS
jgi:anti-sigma factor RsiW